jgi:hypothetical protein
LLPFEVVIRSITTTMNTVCYPRWDGNGETIGCNDSGGDVTDWVVKAAAERRARAAGDDLRVAHTSAILARQRVGALTLV